MGRVKNWFLVLAMASCGLQGAGLNTAHAQQTIFNVPSADVMPEGKMYLQHESSFRPYPPRQYLWMNHWSGYGLGHDTEVTMTLFDVTVPDTRSIDLAVGFKNVHQYFKKRFPDYEFKTILGSAVVPSLEARGDDRGVGNWTYAAVSGRIPRLKTRLTAGVNYGTKQIFGKTTFGFIGGIEQPVSKRVTLLMDWYSGDSVFGLLIPGAGFKVTDTIETFVGYQIPNPSNKFIQSGFVVEVIKLIR